MAGAYQRMNSGRTSKIFVICGTDNIRGYSEKGYSMLKNYLLIALRNIKKHLSYSMIKRSDKSDKGRSN
jgi:hypothetical protein